MNLLTRIEHNRLSAAYATGMRLLRNGKVNRAIIEFQSAIFFAPNVLEPLVAMAECYVTLCDLQSAVRLYRRALWVMRQNESKEQVHKTIELETLPRINQKGKIALQHSDSTTTTTTTTTSTTITKSNSNDGGELKREQNFCVNSSRMTREQVTQRLISLLDALSLTLFRLSDFEQALRFVNEALELQECTLQPELSVHKSIYLIALKQEEEAEFLLEKLLNKFTSEHTHFASLLIHLYCNRQAFRAARIMLDKSFMETDNVDRESLTIARHLFTERFRRYRNIAIARNDIKSISQCIEVYPNDLELLFLRAKLYITANEHKRSVRDLFKCIKETNGTHKAAMEMMTSVLFAIGATLNDDSGIHEAIAYYSESLKWRSNNALVLLARGDCYVRIEDYGSALADYKRVLTIDADNGEAQMRIAKLHDLWGCKFYALQRLHDAEREFSNAIKEVDTEPVFFYHRALTRFALNEPRYALRDVLSCKELHPSSKTLQAFLERFLGTRNNLLESIPSNSWPAYSSRVLTNQLERNKELQTCRAHDSSDNKSIEIKDSIYSNTNNNSNNNCNNNNNNHHYHHVERLPRIVEGKRACLSNRSNARRSVITTTTS